MLLTYILKATSGICKLNPCGDPAFELGSVSQFSHSVVSNSLWPHGLQHARLPCPSPTPGAYSNSCPLSWWCHPTIPSSVIPFSSCPQSFPASGSFPMSWFFASDGQSIGVSASGSVLPMNIQDWFSLGLTGSSIFFSQFFSTPRFKSLCKQYFRERVCMLLKLLPFILRNGILPAVSVNKRCSQLSAVATTAYGELLSPERIQEKNTWLPRSQW